MVVFGSLDVGEHFVDARFCIRHETHGDPCDRTCYRDSRIHECDRTGTDGGHRSRAVRCETLRDDANGVGENIFCRQDRAQRFLRQRAMPRHAAVESANATRLAHAERREVVVEHERFFLVLELDGVDELCVARTSERERGPAVCLSAIKEASAVYDRRDASGLCVERPYLVERATVDTPPFLDGEVVHVLIYAQFEVSVELVRFGVGKLFYGMLHPLRFQSIYFFFAEFPAECLELRF